MLDGVDRQLDPGDPLDRNLYELDALEADHEFLLRGGVFTGDLLEKWVIAKRKEAEEVNACATPYEYVQYFDA